MNGADDGAEEFRRQEEHTQKEELTKKLERLSDEQRQKYQNHVAKALDAHGEASNEFRLGLAKTYLQGLPPREEAIQIRDYSRREQERVSSKDQRVDQEQELTKQTGRDQSGHDLPGQGQPRHDQPGPERTDPMQGMPRTASTTASPRDYTELKKTHDHVAERQSAGAQNATAPLSKEQLEDMSKRFAEVRETQNLERSQPEVRELKELAGMQTKAREKLNHVHGPQPGPQQNQQRELLDHQHLAERVGVEARWLGQDLRMKELPGAERYEQEGRRAHHTGRQAHEQRQNLEANPIRDAARTVQEQDQQKQAEMQQEAQRSGRTVTAEQRANAPDGARRALDREERADAARNVTGQSGNQATHQGPARPGNTRGGGRGR